MMYHLTCPLAWMSCLVLLAHHPYLVRGQYDQPGSFWPEVRIRGGVVRGRTFRTDSGRDYFAYLGIPYATPPLGPLRFRPPIPLPGWSSVLTASSYKDPCPQYDSRASELGNEDCLYLNVYTPNNNVNVYNARLPVMVYIQAESFENGDASLYGPEKLLDKEVVVVTFNYRLGILGFLSTNDDASPGNWGLHDQRMVLEWVKENIDTFSGDPNRVTLFGQGAGAASAHFHILSPSSKGLFHRAIIQSGTALCDWAIERDPLKFAQEVAQLVKCPSSPSHQLVDCLRTLSPSILLNAQSKFKVFGEFPQRTAPVIEPLGIGRFLSEDPRSIMQGGHFQPVPLMIGVNKDEASYFYPLITDVFRTSDDYYHEKNLIPRFLESATSFRGSARDQILPSLLYTYFNGVDLGNLTSVAMRFINMTSDALYNSCMDETIKLYHKAGGPVYQYVFEYPGRNSMVNLLVNNVPTLFPTGICHGDELFYLFNLRILGLREPSLEDSTVSNRMVTLWADFAKYGYAPKMDNYEYPKWDAWDPERRTYYRIGSTNVFSRGGYKQKESHFWNEDLKGLNGISGPSSMAQIKESTPMYKTLAWSMVGVSLSLLGLILVLLAVLYSQRKSQSFRAHTPGSSHMSVPSTLY